MRGVITENVLLLKHKTKTITAALNRENALILLSTLLRKLRIYLLFIVTPGTLSVGNKFPDREFYWSVDHEFLFQIGNQYGQTVL